MWVGSSRESDPEVANDVMSSFASSDSTPGHHRVAGSAGADPPPVSLSGARAARADHNRAHRDIRWHVVPTILALLATVGALAGCASPSKAAFSRSAGAKTGNGLAGYPAFLPKSTLHLHSDALLVGKAAAARAHLAGRSREGRHTILVSGRGGDRTGGARRGPALPPGTRDDLYVDGHAFEGDRVGADWGLGLRHDRRSRRRVPAISRAQSAHSSERPATGARGHVRATCRRACRGGTHALGTDRRSDRRQVGLRRRERLMHAP